MVENNGTNNDVCVSSNNMDGPMGVRYREITSTPTKPGKLYTRTGVNLT